MSADLPARRPPGKRRLPAFLVGVLVLLPGLAIFPRGWWPGSDDVWAHSVRSVELYAHMARSSPFDWPFIPAQHLSKSTALVWTTGLLFVPLGELSGALFAALRLASWVASAAAVALVFSALRRLFAREAIAWAGALALASGPLFLRHAHTGPWPETLQLLAAAWCFHVAAAASKRDPLSTVLQLLAALGFGFLVKVSTPAYVAVPSAVALVVAFKRRSAFRFRPRTHAALGAAALLSCAAAAGWAIEHFPKYASSLVNDSMYSAKWGERLPFFAKVGHWTRSLWEVWGGPLTGWWALAALALALAALLRRRSALRGRFLALAAPAALAAVQLAVLLALFSLVTNQVTRYLLAATPCCTVLLAWALATVNRKWLSAAVLAALALQQGLVYAGMLGYEPRRLLAGEGPARGLRTWAPVLEEEAAAVELVCREPSARRSVLVVGRSSWQPALFAAEKFGSSQERCRFSIGRQYCRSGRRKEPDVVIVGPRWAKRYQRERQQQELHDGATAGPPGRLEKALRRLAPSPDAAAEEPLWMREEACLRDLIGRLEEGGAFEQVEASRFDRIRVFRRRTSAEAPPRRRPAPRAP